MKKINILLICLLSFIPFKINALSGSVNLSCTSTNVTVNNTLNCTLTGNSNAGVSAISAKLTASGNITITNISTSTIWQGNGENGAIELYTDTNKSGTFQIATFTIKASQTAGTGKISVSNVKFSDADFVENNVGSKALTINVKEVQKPTTGNNNTGTEKPSTPTKSKDATLKSLIVNNEKVSLSSNKFEYNVNVKNDVTVANISAQTNSNKAKIDMPKNMNLEVGKNNFEIKVTAEDGTIKNYKLIITRLEKELSNNSKLSELSIADHNIEFSSEVYSYNLGNIELPKLEINAKAADEKSKVEIYGNDNISKNDVIVIKVTAEDKSFSEYTLYVNNNLIKDENGNMYDYAGVYYPEGYAHIWLTFIIFILLVILILTNKDKIYIGRR